MSFNVKFAVLRATKLWSFIVTTIGLLATRNQSRLNVCLFEIFETITKLTILHITIVCKEINEKDNL